jgi:hypothetical protein
MGGALVPLARLSGTSVQAANMAHAKIGPSIIRQDLSVADMKSVVTGTM